MFPPPVKHACFNGYFLRQRRTIDAERSCLFDSCAHYLKTCAIDYLKWLSRFTVFLFFFGSATSVKKRRLKKPEFSISYLYWRSSTVITDEVHCLKSYRGILQKRLGKSIWAASPHTYFLMNRFTLTVFGHATEKWLFMLTSQYIWLRGDV